MNFNAKGNATIWQLETAIYKHFPLKAFLTLIEVCINVSKLGSDGYKITKRGPDEPHFSKMGALQTGTIVS